MGIELLFVGIEPSECLAEYHSHFLLRILLLLIDELAEEIRYLLAHV